MSKTDNTRPYWVRVQDDPPITEEWHVCGASGPPAWVRQVEGHDCDIDTGPRARCRRFYRSNGSDRGDSYGPTPTYVRAEWTGPDRARARAQCRDAVRDFNAHGETDVLVAETAHRHGARWHWW